MEFTHLTSAKMLYRLTLFTGIFFLSSHVQAYSFTPQFNLYGGMSHVHIKKSDLYISSAETDTLSGNTTNHAFTAGLGVNAKKSMNTRFFSEATYGIDILFMNTASSGNVYQYGLSNFNNYRYNLQFQTSRFMLDGTIGLQPIWQAIIPFLKASVGVAEVTTRYHDVNTSSTFQGGDIKLPDHTVYNLAYSLGAGIKKSLTKNLQLSILYLYTDLGTATSSKHSISENNLTLVNPIRTRLQTSTGLIELSVLLG